MDLDVECVGCGGCDPGRVTDLLTDSIDYAFGDLYTPMNLNLINVSLF